MSAIDNLPRAQVEEIRFQQREWKAGYAAAQRHRKWTTVGVIVAVAAVLRHWRVPVVVILAWGMAFVLAFWPLLLVLLIVELHHRRRVNLALAATFADYPFPE